MLQLIIGNLEAVERLDGKNIEPHTTIDEGLGDKDIADDGRAEHRQGTGGFHSLELVGELKVMVHLDHLSGRVASSLGRAAFSPRANCLKMRWEAGA